VFLRHYTAATFVETDEADPACETVWPAMTKARFD
jgi:hypothetical protein